MDRNLHKKYIPFCPRHIAQVDQYSWENVDTNYYRCFNGISHPIYDCKGEVNYTLPLEYYPLVGEIHPQIDMTRRMHLQWRGMPDKKVPIRERFNFEKEGQGSSMKSSGERFYNKRKSQNLPPRFHTQQNSYLELDSDMVPGYPLPSPYIDTNSGRCNSCN